MIIGIIIASLTCITMILSVLFFPKFRFGKWEPDSYWIIVLLGAMLMLLSGKVRLAAVVSALTANTATNPGKILVLFISMTLLSIFLDEIGFFRFLANRTLQKAKASQMKLFILLYLTVSVLTVFTSNDIIILSFTPFICYFAKNARIDPLPYLAGEFVAANTWSMALIIGNPTNIYLGTEFGIDFLTYVKVMLLPTLAAGITALLLLLLLFRKKLREPIQGEAYPIVLKEKLLLWVGIAHLGAATLILAVGSYVGIEMWKAALFSCLSLYVFGTVIALLRRQLPVSLLNCLRRAPWQLIPFVLSMFVLISGLTEQGVTAGITGLLGESRPVLRYGVASFLSANLINNIPMSVLFGAVMEPLTEGARLRAVYAAVVGSNLGAFLTPIGALAGIMWSSLIGQQNIRFSYLDFVKTCAPVAVPTLAAALIVLALGSPV